MLETAASCSLLLRCLMGIKQCITQGTTFADQMAVRPNRYYTGHRREPRSTGKGLNVLLLKTDLPSVALWPLEAATAKAAVGRAAAAADDLQLLLGAVCAVQQLLDELLQAHLGVGLARRRLLQELVDLGHLPAGGRRTSLTLGK